MYHHLFTGERLETTHVTDRIGCCRSEQSSSIARGVARSVLEIASPSFQASANFTLTARSFRFSETRRHLQLPLC